MSSRSNSDCIASCSVLIKADKEEGKERLLKTFISTCILLSCLQDRNRFRSVARRLPLHVIYYPCTGKCPLRRKCHCEDHRPSLCSIMSVFGNLEILLLPALVKGVQSSPPPADGGLKRPFGTGSIIIGSYRYDCSLAGASANNFSLASSSAFSSTSARHWL